MSQSTNLPKRRELHFRTLDDIVRDIRGFAGTTPASTGNWSPGQIVEHVAKGIDLSVDGFDFKAPLPLRLFGRLMRNHYLAKGFPAGIKPRGRMKDVFEPAPDADFAAASRHLADAVERAKHQGMSATSPMFGRLTHDQWTQLNCRHAELHFGFLKPEQP